MKIISVVGARPNFMKVAPLHRAMARDGSIESHIVHTGQHYDARMSDIFFRQLEMPEPHVYLGVGSGSHAQQTAKIMTAFEEAVQQEAPDLVLVVGDVNSTLACSLVAAKARIPLAHVEAGLRSFDRRMPEEINRLVTDSMADYLFVTEQSGMDNLKREGVPDEKVFFVGNVMIDSLTYYHDKIARNPVLEEYGLTPKQYVLMTVHRPSNVDDPEHLRELVHAIEGLAATHRVVFPVHPRTLAQLDAHGLHARLEALDDVLFLEPQGYLEFVKLMEHAAVVITDSGGLQEETTYLGVPCLTLRENTERPVTIDLGTNELLPLDASRICRRVEEIERGDGKLGQVPPLWDGHAAERIVSILKHAQVNRQAHMQEAA